MKNFILLCLISLIVLSCQDNEDIVTKEEIDSSVINTFTTNLQDGVDSIQLVTELNSLFQEASASGYIDSNTLETASPAIYFYNDSTKALLLENVSGNVVYIYLVNSDNNSFKGAYIAYLNEKTTLKAGEPILQIESLISEELVYSYSSNSSLKGWGDCMDDAIDQLYDDWDEDPVGTTVCWLTGPLCVIGGGLACGILEF
jgi:hypothetical protein